MKYYIDKTIQADFDSVVQKAKDALADEGFGIVSEIDIDEKIREKLGVEFGKYKILGACNPSIAYKALQLEDKIGTMLPCNVIVRETPDHRVEVAAVDPLVSMAGVGNDGLNTIAGEVKDKLARVIESIKI